MEMHLAPPNESARFPGAEPHERAWDFDSEGCRLRVHEWGDPAGPPLVLVHGLWDHAHGFDLLAPRLAGSYRVIAYDRRGHGDSAWVDNYVWEQDVMDLLRLLRAIGQPACLLGHSHGGSIITNAASYAPEIAIKLVNIDGFGPSRNFATTAGDRPRPGTTEALRAFFDARRILHTRPEWPAVAELNALVSRRKRQNPRLSEAWLNYFCAHGCRRDPDGYRWKLDPLTALTAGPFKPEWIGRYWMNARAPLLAITGTEQDTWGPIEPDLLAERLSCVRQHVHVHVNDAGHFVHVEQPAVTARLVLDFLTS